MKAIFFYVIMAFLCLSPLSGQEGKASAFSLDWTTDGILGGVSLGVVIPSFFIDLGPGTQPPRADINALDRNLAHFAYRPGLDTLGDVGAYGLLAAPGLFSIPLLSASDKDEGKQRLLTYGVMYAEAFALTHGTKELMKGVISRYRPYTYSGGSLPYIPPGLEKDYYNSFPSGHSSYAFLGASFISAIMVNDYADSKWKWPVIIGVYALAGTTAALRVASGNHFVTDVLVGAAIGSLYGWTVPLLHKKF
jgi:membrane-associated phospholipid phosphatase